MAKGKTIRNETEHSDEYKLYLREGIQVTLTLISKAYFDLYPACCEIEKCSSKDELFSQYMAALSIAWTFIDNYRLVLNMLGCLPEENRNDILLKELKLQADPLIAARNYHYHYEAANKFDSFGQGPAFGNLSWKSPDSENECVIAVPSFPSRTTESMSLVFDRENNIFTSKVALSIHDNVVDFVLLFDLLEKYISSISNRREGIFVNTEIFCFRFCCEKNRATLKEV